MRHSLWFAALTFSSLACATGVSEDAPKGVVVRLDNLKATTPADWKEEEPSNKMRFKNFRLTKDKEDKIDAEVVIFNSASGGAKANIARWKNLFVAPDGKTIDDVAKVQEIKIGGLDATRVELAGTYKAPPFDPTFKGAQPDFHMVAIYLEGPDKVYQIRMIGPAKTVEKHKKGFDEWIKSFK